MADAAMVSEMKFDDACSSLRKEAGALGETVRGLMSHPVFSNETTRQQDPGEMRANIMLAYRHIEDARMRLGKAIQAFDGGVSVYER